MSPAHALTVAVAAAAVAATPAREERAENAAETHAGPEARAAAAGRARRVGRRAICTKKEGRLLATVCWTRGLLQARTFVADSKSGQGGCGCGGTDGGQVSFILMMWEEAAGFLSG